MIIYQREYNLKQYDADVLKKYNLEPKIYIYVGATTRKMYERNSKWRYSILTNQFCVSKEIKQFMSNLKRFYKYELDLLKKKIRDAEKEVSVDYKREDMMLTKQNVLLTLIDKCKFPFGKKYDEIVNDIRSVEQINLNVEEGADYKEIKFLIGKTKREGILYVDKNSNKFINDHYKKLYDILRKYDLIYKIESVENCEEDMTS